MRRCEDEKMFYRPPLLEEPCAQTLSGKTGNGHFGPNPGLERFRAGFWHLGRLHLAIKLLTKKKNGNGHFGPNPGQEAFEAGFWHLNRLQMVI